MDKRTRVFNAMDKKEVDHVPVGFWYHFGKGQNRGEACVKAHLDYVRDVDTDLLKIMCDSYFDYPIPQNIVSAEDWYKLQPLTPEHPFIAEQVERARRLVEEIGREMPVFYNVFCPFSSIRFGAGEERVMRDLRENPEAVLYALDVIAASNALLTEELIKKAGCDGIYYCVQGGEKNRFTYEEYRKWIRPSDLSVLEKANALSDYNILHCCGWAGDSNRIEDWQDYPVKCVNWAVYVEKLSLEEGRDFFGGKACLGGFESLHREGMTNQGLLHEGTRDEIRAFTKNLIAAFGKTGLILGADCTVDSAIDHDRIRWVVEAAREV